MKNSFRWAIVVTALVVLAQLGSGRSPAAAVMGGVPAPGDPAVVYFESPTTTSGCSGSLWKPRVVLTAAHCVVAEGSGSPVDPSTLRIQFPGSDVSGYGAGIEVRSIAIPAGYINRDARVQPNDIAIVTLAAPLGPAGVTRLASRAEMDSYARLGVAVEHIGYGLIRPGEWTNLPHTVTLPLASYSSADHSVRTRNSATASPCPGDSGSPVLYRSSAGRLQVGVFAGSNSACARTPSGTYSTLSFAPIGYLGMLNPALSAVGEPPVPGGPLGLTATARNRDATITWQPPTESPQSVTGYEVSDAGGTVVCTTTVASCVVPGLADGSHTFMVRSRNSQGEGDSAASPAAVSVAPPSAPGTPSVKVTGGRAQVTWSAPTGSAVVGRYTVRLTAVGSDRQRTLCSTTAIAASPPVSECAAPLKPGTYRVVVQADTGMGEAPASPASRRFTVRAS